jgi:hypothetical protein
MIFSLVVLLDDCFGDVKVAYNFFAGEVHKRQDEGGIESGIFYEA